MPVIYATELQRREVVAQLEAFMCWARQRYPKRGLVVLTTEAEHTFGAVRIPPGVAATLWAGCGDIAVTFMMVGRGVSVHRNGDIGDSTAPHDSRVTPRTVERA